MKIFVCVKPVPDTAAKIKVGGGASIDPAGVKFVLGPYDSRAASKAIALRDAAGDGSEVVAVAAGNPNKGESEARKRIKDVLALGADRGILIPDESYENRDPLAVAKALAAAIKNEGEFDLVFTGRQAVDDQAFSVGPMLATLLGVPCVTDVVGLEVDGKTATVKRAAEGRVEVLSVNLPCVITAQRDLAEEQYPKLKEILKANKKKIDTFSFEWPAPAYRVTELSPPPEPAAGKIVGEGPDAVPELVRLLREEAKALSF
ncbi:MAG: electron transfer flavoprotein subunit beta/FixA family protein [Planctomycetota bacterium]|nr:MAG: electron transfer flavoprotein subunit beta/FixA family protein [Planctomycetota bacterium]